MFPATVRSTAPRTHRTNPRRSAVSEACCACLPCCNPRQEEMGHPARNYERVSTLSPDLVHFKRAAEFVGIKPREPLTLRHLLKYVVLIVIVGLGTAYLPLSGFKIAEQIQSIFNLSAEVVFFLNVLFTLAVSEANFAINTTSTEKGITVLKENYAVIKQLANEREYKQLTVKVGTTTLKVGLAAVGSLATVQFANDVALHSPILSPLVMRSIFVALSAAFDGFQKFRVLNSVDKINPEEVQKRYEYLVVINEIIGKIDHDRVLKLKELKALAHGQLEMRSDRLNVLMTFVAIGVTSVYVFGARLESTEIAIRTFCGLTEHDTALYVTLPAYLSTFLQWAFLARPLKWYSMTLLNKLVSICNPQHQHRFPKTPGYELAIWGGQSIINIFSGAGAAWTVWRYSDIVHNSSSDPRLQFLYTCIITLLAAYMINDTDSSLQTIRVARWIKLLCARKDHILENRLIYSDSAVGDAGMVNYLLKMMLALSVKPLVVPPVHDGPGAAPAYSFWAKLFASLGLCRLSLPDPQGILNRFAPPERNPSEVVVEHAPNRAPDPDLIALAPPNLAASAATNLDPASLQRPVSTDDISGFQLPSIHELGQGDDPARRQLGTPTSAGSPGPDEQRDDLSNGQGEDLADDSDETTQLVNHTLSSARPNDDVEAGRCFARLFSCCKRSEEAVAPAPEPTAAEKQAVFERSLLKLYRQTGERADRGYEISSGQRSGRVVLMHPNSALFESFIETAFSR